MCGINGIVEYSGFADVSRLQKMNEIIYHRGPDSGNIWVSEDKSLAFGHRRLSIIDLSSSGNQPMIDETNGNVVILNGEIYNFIELKKKLIKSNYKFISNSDTEVLLKAYDYWGSNFLKNIEGMFAFAIYDKKYNKIIFARDRAGEKPFFYKLSDDSFIFSSELKSILKTTRKRIYPNKDSIDCFFGMGFVPGEDCIIDGINKLESGHYIELDCNTLNFSVNRYWFPPVLNKSLAKNQNIDLKLSQLETLLSDSVKKQLVSDVPIGVLLSGGVDSSLITAFAARHKSNIQTFTVIFPEDKKYDESKYARQVANKFNTTHIELEAKNIDPQELLPKLARQYDEPIIDSSMIPTYLITQLVKKHCSVVLGGDGGDELFGGYKHYSKLLLSQKITGFLPMSLKKNLHFLSNFFPIGMRGKIWLQSIKYDLKSELPLIASYFDKKEREKLIISDNWPLVSETIRKKRTFVSDDLLERATRTDFNNYLVEDILVKTDRASMLNSLELRAPFLSREIMEFAFTLKNDYKTNIFERKIILKMLSKKVLPSDFNSSRKQGFAIPLNHWLKSKLWLDFFKDVLFEKNSLFNQKYLDNLFTLQKKNQNLGERLFALVMFKLWAKEYNISFEK